MPARARGARLTAELLARCTFPPTGSPVDCAFSGGADSTALLVLAQRAGGVVRAWHVDHGLHADSARAADIARETASTLGVQVEVVTVDVAPGSDLEARARAARFAALPQGVLTGHTADDRAETLLVNLLRGSGVDGLAAMGPSPRRPLLALRRAETHALCAELGLAVVEDPMNADDRFVRNRIRHELLPLMSSIADRDVAPLLVRTAEVVAADMADVPATTIDPTDARVVAAAAASVARRVLRRWLVVDGYPPDLATVERVLAVARGEHRACEIGGGRRVERHRQRLRIVAAGQVRSSIGMQDGDGN